MRCMLCRKHVDELSEHGLCEECEKQFDFSKNEPYEPEEGEDSGKTLAKRILISSVGVIALILFMVWIIPLLLSLVMTK